MKRVLILGGAGRDFHNFNVWFRDNSTYHVVAFTATQIPDGAGRRYPAELAGSLCPERIPILEEKDRCRSIAGGFSRRRFKLSQVWRLLVVWLSDSVRFSRVSRQFGVRTGRAAQPSIFDIPLRALQIAPAKNAAHGHGINKVCVGWTLAVGACLGHHFKPPRESGVSAGQPNSYLT
jgi:hypothetical protein